MQQKNAYPVNSREWWEEYFVENWEARGGSSRTRYFMQRLLDELSTSEIAFLRSRPLIILDWGCAFGEGVDLLAQSFPQSQVVGLDFASRAIGQARQRHPNREFMPAKSGEIPGEFDVIVNSDCLEYFEHPLEVMKSHLRSCRRLYIALVPHNELPLSEHHRSQFRQETFPERLGDFVKLCARVINTDPAFWNGQQFLVVYGSQSYLCERVAIESEDMQRAEMNNALTDSPTLSSAAEQRPTQLTVQADEKDRTIEMIEDQLAEKQQEIQSLSSEIANKEKNLRKLSLRAAEKEQAERALSFQLMAKEQTIQALSDELAAKEAELKKITGSLGWRLLNRYGRIKYRYLLPIYRTLGLPPYNKKRSEGNQINQPASNQLPATVEAKPLPSAPPADSISLAQTLSKQAAPQEPAYIPYESNAYDVICFPIIDWDFRFQRPQQLMSRFADAGHRVFYIASGFRSSGPAYTIQEKRKNIYEVSFCGLELNVYRDVLDGGACDALFASLDALRRELLLHATVAFVQLPFWWLLANKARAEFAWPIVYDCMDYHAGFSTNNQEMLTHERDLLSSADLVVVSSTFLENEARQHNSNVLLVHNACDYRHFAKTRKAISRRPVIGYYGAIADWFDSDLVADLAEKQPDWDFVLIGSTFTADTSRLSKLANVSLPGEKPYSEIPDWLGKFDAAIIPFKRTALTEATNPVKAYEIFAAGKPLVSVPIPEMAALAPLVRLASNAEEFESEIIAALNENDSMLIRKRQAFAREHSWEKRYAMLVPAVREAFPKASIIIVTFNNLELNRLCLESLYTRTEWPNFEVIVIDNGSSDGTPEYLKEAAQDFPYLRVILNESNLGFAAANNIGLKEATGDYLVLLNNDTVVTRGWISALIRHLHIDRRLGMIGPVTNAIGNEAKVEAGYAQLDEMAVWAANYVREHDGQTFPLPMLAMFCVAMRREVFEKVGYLDERFGVGMFEDDDYARRHRQAGYELRCARDSFIHHWQKASFHLLGEEEYLRLYQENRSKYQKKWENAGSASGPSVKTAKSNPYNDQLQEVLARVHNSKGAIVFLPSVGWNIHLFQRPHHLAREFARQGYVSIFDGSNAYDDVNGFKEIEPNLFLFRADKELLNYIPEPILWAFPYNFDFKDFCSSTARTVYDWIDDLEVFPYDRAFLERNHRRALKEADVVASVARRLHERAMAVRSDAIYLPNGVEYDRFADEGVAIADDADIAAMLREGKPIAGYYGALAEWFDYELINEVARLRADWNFLLIGPEYDDSIHKKGQDILNRANVFWIGPKQYELLPGYLRIFDVATIPFAINNITLATSPLKLYEYMAAGKPIITTSMPECQSFPEVNIVRDAEEFSQALDMAREQGRDSEFRNSLRSLAWENSWTARVQTVEKLFQTDERRNHHSSEQAPAVVSRAAVQQEVKTLSLPTLSGPAADIAERLRHFRTGRNEYFFNALCNHFSSIPSDPCLPMYFEFAITCNERGRQVARLLEKYTKLNSKRFLDVGCAYGGFPVAFAEQGAEVIGIDYDRMLLNLARYNLQDNNVDAPLLLKDATRSEDMQEFRNGFDIITCNDVIEHVDDPEALLRNIADMLRSDAIAYFEIPNRYHPHYVLQDGHYQLFGITLLDYPEAEEYYSLHAPGVPYAVRHYLELDEYARLFERCGMRLTVLDESFESVNVQMLLDDIHSLQDSAKTKLNEVPSAIRKRVEERLSHYLKEIETFPRSSASEQRDFMLRYGAGFWRVLGQKTVSQTNDIVKDRYSAAPNNSPIYLNEFLPAQAQRPSEVLIQNTLKKRFSRFEGMSFHPGRCNVCGNQTLFFYKDETLYRESLTCGECLTTSRYRSIARGILRAIKELTGIEARSVAELNSEGDNMSLKIYDTQEAFYYETCAYPIPDLLSKRTWIDLQRSVYHPQQPLGISLGSDVTNQNLEALTYPDNSFDIVITSDVMEHVRLDTSAHWQIRRVLKPGGIYLFTVPHHRDQQFSVSL